MQSLMINKSVRFYCRQYSDTVQDAVGAMFSYPRTMYNCNYTNKPCNLRRSGPSRGMILNYSFSLSVMSAYGSEVTRSTFITSSYVRTAIVQAVKSGHSQPGNVLRAVPHEHRSSWETIQAVHFYHETCILTLHPLARAAVFVLLRGYDRFFFRYLSEGRVGLGPSLMLHTAVILQALRCEHLQAMVFMTQQVR